MSRRNEGKTNFSKLKRDREKYLKDSGNRIHQLKKILEILKERGFDDGLVQKLYKREIARNKRLTKLIGDEK